MKHLPPCPLHRFSTQAVSLALGWAALPQNNCFLRSLWSLHRVDTHFSFTDISSRCWWSSWFRWRGLPLHRSTRPLCRGCIWQSQCFWTSSKAGVSLPAAPRLSGPLQMLRIAVWLSPVSLTQSIQSPAHRPSAFLLMGCWYSAQPWTLFSEPLECCWVSTCLQSLYLVWASLFFSVPWFHYHRRKNRVKLGTQRTLYFRDRNHHSAVPWA